jgi:hypothetical protein
VRKITAAEVRKISKKAVSRRGTCVQAYHNIPPGKGGRRMHRGENAWAKAMVIAIAPALGA